MAYTVKREGASRNLLEFFTLPHRLYVDPLGTLSKRGSALRNHPGFQRNSYFRHSVEPLWMPPRTNFYLFIIITCCYG